MSRAPANLQRAVAIATGLPITLPAAVPTTGSASEPSAPVATPSTGAEGVPLPPTVEQCRACRGAGVWCSEECYQTGRVVSGGTLPPLSRVAERLRYLVREDMSVAPAGRMFAPEWLDELAVLAESCDRHDGALKALQDERDEWKAASDASLDALKALQERAETAERALRIAEASARMNAETSRQQSIEWREANALLHAEIRRLQRQLRGEAVGA